MPPRPAHAVAQAHEPQADEQQDPWPEIRQHADPQPRTRQGEERHIHRQRPAFQLATQPLALDRREVLQIEPGSERDDQRFEVREPRHLRGDERRRHQEQRRVAPYEAQVPAERVAQERAHRDRKSTRLNSSHGYISYAVFCLKKKKALTKRMTKAWSTYTTAFPRHH